MPPGAISADTIELHRCMPSLPPHYHLFPRLLAAAALAWCGLVDESDFADRLGREMAWLADRGPRPSLG